jgi:kinesin family protein 2/24
MCGFFEIYNGQLFDLINQNSRLVLREDSNGQLNVVGLVEVEIKSLNDLRKIIEKSQSNRHIGTTSFNKASSRSHAVVQFKVINNYSNLYDDDNNDNKTVSSNKKFSSVKSKINSGLNKNESNSFNRSFRILFVDLAGSERGIDAQNNTQDNRKEGAEINQSLLAVCVLFI